MTTNFSSAGSQVAAGFAQQSGASSAGVSKAGGWGAAIGAVVDLGLTLHSARMQRKALKSQLEAEAQRNTAVLKEMHRSLVALELDRSLAMRRLQQARFDTETTVRGFRSALELNRAASGMYGSSFDALQQDLTRQREEAMQRITDNAEITGIQYANKTQSLINTAVNQTSIGSGSVQSFDLAGAMAGLGSALEPLRTGYANWQNRGAVQGVAQSSTGSPGITLNAQWSNINSQGSASNPSVAYNLGLY